jgi:hypothetical protein
MLEDNVMNAAQELIRKLNPRLDGLENVNYSQADGDEGFDPQPGESLQTHHGRNLHWSESTTVGGVVRYYDSMYEMPNDAVRAQLVLLYGNRVKPEPFTVIVESQQKQNSYVHCGDYSIATAVDIATGVAPADIARKQWDESKMRGHLLKCFEAGAISPFPTRVGKKARRVIASPRSYMLYPDLRMVPIGKQAGGKMASPQNPHPEGETDDSEAESQAAAPPLFSTSSRSNRLSKPSSKALQAKGLQSAFDVLGKRKPDETRAKTAVPKKKRQKTEPSKPKSKKAPPPARSNTGGKAAQSPAASSMAVDSNSSVPPHAHDDPKMDTSNND